MKRILCAALALILLLTACGHSTAAEPLPVEEAAERGGTEDEAAAAIAPPIQDHQALALYQAFIEGSLSARQTYEDENGSASRDVFLRSEGIYLDLDGRSCDVRSFQLTDMDGDGARELILYTYPENIAWEQPLILSCYDGTLYLNEENPYSFQTLRRDGTFCCTGGAVNMSLLKAHFEHGMQPQVLAAYFPDSDANGQDSSLPLRYEIGGEPASEAEWNALWRVQELKAPVKSYDWTAENRSAVFQADARARSLYQEFIAGTRSAAYLPPNDGQREIFFFQPPDVFTVDEAQNLTWRVVAFALVDLDGDGARELILSATNGGAGEIEILTCSGGELFVSREGVRSFCELWTDGSFLGSGGVDTHYLLRADFPEGAMKTERLAYSTHTYPQNEPYYEIGGCFATALEWDTLMEVQRGKAVADWYPWNPENLAAALTDTAVSSGFPASEDTDG